MLNFPVLHIMTYDHGTWTCPECGRTVQAWPVFLILVKGDQTAIHQGSTGGLVITAVTVSTATPDH